MTAPIPQIASEPEQRGLAEIESVLTRVTLKTPMILRVLDRIMSLLEDGHNGAVIYAPPRVGKSRAIKMLSRVLSDCTTSFSARRLSAATVSIEVPNRKKNVNEGPFWDWLSIQVGSGILKGGLPAKRHRVYQAFIDKARANPTGRLILFIDEAQYLSAVEYGWFADIYNQLEKQGLTLIILQFGSEDIKRSNQDLRTGAYLHVRERFFAGDVRFDGIRTAKDMSECLAQYETAKPKETGGVTIVDYVRPHWKRQYPNMSVFSSQLFDAFMAAHSSIKNDRFEIPMKHFCMAVRMLLLSPNATISESDLVSIVERTEFRNYLTDGVDA